MTHCRPLTPRISSICCCCSLFLFLSYLHFFSCLFTLLLAYFLPSALLLFRSCVNRSWRLISVPFLWCVFVCNCSLAPQVSCTLSRQLWSCTHTAQPGNIGFLFVSTCISVYFCSYYYTTFPLQKHAHQAPKHTQTLKGSYTTLNLNVNDSHNYNIFIVRCLVGIYPKNSHCRRLCGCQWVWVRLNLLLRQGQADCSRGQTHRKFKLIFKLIWEAFSVSTLTKKIIILK